MARKYINKRNNEDFSSEDEWSHITEIGEKIEVLDPLEIQDRKIFLSTEQELPKTHWEKTKEATRDAMDRAGNTGQYIKYVNNHLENKNNEINRIKKIKEKFQQEVDLLKNNHTVQTSYHNIPHDLRNREDLQKLKNKLIEEKSATKSYLNKLKSETNKMQEKLHSQELELKEIDNCLSKASFNTTEEAKTESIREEIKLLSEKYDPKTLAQILGMLESSLQKSSMQ